MFWYSYLIGTVDNVIYFFKFSLYFIFVHRSATCSVAKFIDLLSNNQIPVVILF